jgi:hypothetical protein
VKLFSKISVNTHYTRSVNVERDAGNEAVIQAYIPTSRALRTLERVASTFSQEQAPRAWSLVGPYGSGKSSFSVFLSQLLDNPSDAATKTAFSVLKKADDSIAKSFLSHTKNSEGYCQVVLTGSPEPLAKRILQALHKAAKESLGGKAKVIAALQEAGAKQIVSTSELIGLVSQLQDALVAKKVKGIIFTIDELGKFLEYEARHYGANDIFLLQSLAEHACKGHKVNLFLFVLLHQSFEQYAKGLGENLKKEWSKVQGRFEEIPFLESAEQILRVVAAAFTQRLNDSEKRLVRNAIQVQVHVLQQQGALPPSMSSKEALDLFTSCYPLHPVSAILLPLLCQKIAQNERTLFSYLGSQESNGLSDLLGVLELGDFVTPHHIYDYFITNQPAVIGDHFTHRRWVEVVTALDRLGDAPESTIQLLKTVGILNIIGAKGGLKASKDILELCIGSDFKKPEKVLLQKSLVTYRKFNGEYRVWQGSDFDLEEALRDEQGKLGNFSLARVLASRKAMLPVVARRYTIESGALRYFQPVFVDAQTYKDIPSKPSDPTLVFYLAAGQDDEEFYHSSIVKYYSELCITALCLNGSQLREATAEVLALQQVQINCQELNSDPIAKREFQDRMTAAEMAEDELLQNLMDYPGYTQWFWRGKRLPVGNKRQLQEQFSYVLDKVYYEAPVIHNELINRDKPSAQANAARNKLLYAMLNHEQETDLGIDKEKFPPEKAIYRSLLRATGLHKPATEMGSDWHFCEPGQDKVSDKLRMRFVWQHINAFLDSTEKEAKSFAELNQVLMEPPYGLKAGLLPVLYIAAFAVYQHELALYESRVYRPYFTEEMLERFVKRPDEFSVQRFRIKGIRASLFNEYSRALHGDDNQRSMLDLARALATEMGKLPEFTQKTEQGISKRAKDVRSAFNLAKSPEHLLFNDLPRALGFDSEQMAGDEKQLSNFAELFTQSLLELRTAYARLLDKQRELLAQAFHVTNLKISLKELRKVVAGRCHGLEHYTVDTQGLRALIMRLTKATSSDEEWLENVLMFLGHKPSKKWLDSDQSVAEHRLASFTRSLLDLEQLRIYEEKRSNHVTGDFDVYLLRSIKKGGEFRDEVVAIDQRSHKHIQPAKLEIFNLLTQLGDKELQLAALAEIVDEFFEDCRSSEKESIPKKRGRPHSIRGNEA